MTAIEKIEPRLYAGRCGDCGFPVEATTRPDARVALKEHREEEHMDTKATDDGPTVPRIACSKCGTEHHYDAAGGYCRECSAFLRDSTEQEDIEMGEFLVSQMEDTREVSRD